MLRNTQHSRPKRRDRRERLPLSFLSLLLAAAVADLTTMPRAAAQNVSAQTVTNRPVNVFAIETNVLYKRIQPGEVERPVATTNRLGFDEQLRSDLVGSATLQVGGTQLRMRRDSRLVIKPPIGRAIVTIIVETGSAYFFGRGRADEIALKIPQRTLMAQGTEYEISVTDDQTIVTVFEGVVAILGDQTTNSVIAARQQGVFRINQPPQISPINTDNIIQWWLYYPGVIDTDELPFDDAERGRFTPSIEAWRRGDFAEAARRLPPEAAVPSVAGRIFRTALDLGLGEVTAARNRLQPMDEDHPLATALRTVIAAIHHDADYQPSEPRTASELVARSYWHQSKSKLDEARGDARAATVLATNFGFAWRRLAELEFSFGRIAAAHNAVTQALALAPDDAEAHTIRGFLLAAGNRIRDAEAAFERSLELDHRLGNAWLGRGLCRIRRGRLEEGRTDLQAAALMEPNRSLLRSYLGKAFIETGDTRHATNELEYAKLLDPNDPTPWLYSALLNREENRINQAVGDLERSIDLNNNRAVYRSRFLLDEDLAVRSSSLANLFQSAGMNEVAVQEAARAVSYDYANYSAHLFLSESYNALRDPTRFNLRYETVWFNEVLLANLLSPVGGTPLSQHISQQEYSRLFEHNRIGLSTDSSYRSDSQFRELASQFGVIGNTAWSLDLDYQHNNGIRPNNELDRIEWYTTFKQQLTPRDSVLLQATYEDFHSGDNFQYYDSRRTNPIDSATMTPPVRPHFRFDEFQTPILIAGYHREWAPGIHTLFLGGRLENEQHFSDQAVPQILLTELDTGEITNRIPGKLDIDYRSELEIYTAELNQILQRQGLAISAGARYQAGQFSTRARMDNPTGPFPPKFFDGTPTVTASTDSFERRTAYGYLTLEPLDRLWVTTGLAYDDIRYPRNFRHPPITSGEDERSQLGPKAAVVWNPIKAATLRGVFTRSLGGVSLDDNYRLEPTELAGFPQTFRTVISESVVGSVAAPEYQTFGLALDLKMPSRTYLGIQAEQIESRVHRTIGAFVRNNGNDRYDVESISERLEYREQSLALNLNQFLGDCCVIGASYRFIRAELHDVLPDVPVSVISPTDHRADLHHTSVYIQFDLPTGVFARAETHLYRQQNSGYDRPVPQEDFFQHNLFVGYRFPRQRADITLGILNLLGQDYHLNPLTVYEELPRERLFTARVRFRF